MGSAMSKTFRRNESSSHHPPPTPPMAVVPPPRTISNPNFGTNPDVNPNAQINPSEAELSSFEAESQSDPELQKFDSTLQSRTSHAINSIAVGLEMRSLSLDSLRDVTESLLEMNQEVVKIILQNKMEVWKNKELSDLVDDYFDNSLLTLDFCNALGACLTRAGHIESIINVALRKFKEEHHAAVPEGSVKSYSRTLEELSNFRAAEAPFSQEFFTAFSTIYTKQISMMQRLQSKKKKLDKKLGNLKAWKKVSYVIFVSTFAAILICSVLAAALHASPVVIALATAASVPLGSIGAWLNSLWKKCEKELKGQKVITTTMQFGNFLIIKDLDNIRVLVESFQIKIEALVSNADFATREDEAVVIAMEEIKKEVEGFVKTIHELSKHANKCSQETTMARTVVLRTILNPPNSSNETGLFS